MLCDKVKCYEEKQDYMNFLFASHSTNKLKAFTINEDGETDDLRMFKNEATHEVIDSCLENEMLNHILQENVAISVGNCIIVPPCKETKVDDDYICVETTIEGEVVNFIVHTSRLGDEAKGMAVYDISKFNVNDLQVVFNNQIPAALIEMTQEVAHVRI